MRELPIGIFDSGMGGISVLKEMKKLMPYEDYIYYGDSKNIPYGIKTKEELQKLCIQIGDYFINRGVKSIVIACNTATSASVDLFRERYDIPIIGVEPALKPAIERHHGGKIIVLATNVTLKEKKFAKLMDQYKDEADIIKLPAPKLVTVVENGITKGEEAQRAILETFEGIDIKEVSSVVLGCTHYIFLKDTMKKILGDEIELIDGGEGTAIHLKNVLSEKGWLKDEEKEGTIEIINSSDDEEKINLSYTLLKS
ncbi:glutamate racemase [Inediibacterium massiliense]|uniref:glutamate racemase n=1 Tax=Inediibacterium massiliense TaxID=1658111 RepID=UPI000A98C843|nr:glutamate racemase [Inediibacterium massiliense]